MRVLGVTTVSSLALLPPVVSCHHPHHTTLAPLRTSLPNLQQSGVRRRAAWGVGGGGGARGVRAQGRARGVVVAMAAGTITPVEVLVKAAVGQPDQLGDCPFSQRVLLTLETKGIPYDAKYIDTANKPSWFLEANPEGKVPVIKDEGKWVADSDVITQLLEEKFPEPSLKTPEDKASVGSKIFPSFTKFLKSKDSSDGSEEALVEELKALDEHLKTNSPYIAGEKLSAADLALAPKLYHLKIALGHYKNWSIPQDMTSLLSYIETVHTLEAFKKTKAPEAVVLKGWSKFFE